MKLFLKFFVLFVFVLFNHPVFSRALYKENFETVKSVKRFDVFVGNWYRLKDKNNYVYIVDGKRWGNKIAGDLKPKIAKLFGEKYYAYMDNIKKYYYFPLAVYERPIKSNKYEISVRIKPISGKVDQSGGIVFGMKDPGNYYVLRSNVLENNCVLFGYSNGKRYTIKWVQFKKKGFIQRNVWHTLKVEVDNNTVRGYLNNMKFMEVDFSKGVSGKRRKIKNKFFLSRGKIGLWSKADSKTYFDDFVVNVK